jgi:hypothetical protein
MKKSILLFLILFQTCIYIYAQDVQSTNKHELDLYIINGYAVSYKFPSHGILNYRINLDFGAHYGDVSGYTSGLSSYNGTKSINRNISITLTPQVYLYFLSTKYAKMYAGLGPFLNYQYLNEDSNVDYGHDKLSGSLIYKNSSYSFGLSVLYGVETELTNHIKLFAESQISGGKRWIENKTNNFASDGNQYWETNTSKTWFADYSNIRIGLGVSF